MISGGIDESGDPAKRDEEADPGQSETTYVDAVFGRGQAETNAFIQAPLLKTRFAPWHHPVKQVIRDYQWMELTRRLVEKERRPEQRHTLRYFTLPGADLLDVRALSEAVNHTGCRIEYFGFDVGYEGWADEGVDEEGVYFATESELRQAGRITDDAEILNDRLEDIAQPGTQAANRLRQKSVFDVVNIDACDHLGFVPDGRVKSIFDAMETLLAHQLHATDSWLLFITTRANPVHLGPPATKMQGAIHGNLEQHHQEFGSALAECIGGEVKTLAASLAAGWAQPSESFLKLFCVGLGKYLLQFYHGQHNLPADVELVSAFTYRVHDEQPDMLSLAFRIIPRGLRVQPPTAGAASVVGTLELRKAVGVTQRASRLWDVDMALSEDNDVRKDAVDGTLRLLESAHYDLDAWKHWLAHLPSRPLNLGEALG